MSILHHVEADTEERDAYQRLAAQRRRNGEEEGVVSVPSDSDLQLSAERIAALEAREQFILSVAEDGMGKRSSAFDYRITRRGGKGIDNMDLQRGRRPAASVVAAFPVQDSDHLMLVTDGGQLIRCPVSDIRIAGRRTQGVTLFRVAEDERVVSVTRIEETNGGDGDENGEEAAQDSNSGEA